MAKNNGGASTAAGPSSPARGSGGATNTGGTSAEPTWQKVAELQLEFMDKYGTLQKALADAHLTEEQASYVEEQVNELRATVQAKWMLVSELGINVREMNVDRSKMNAWTKRCDDNTTAIDVMQAPEHVVTSDMLDLMWRGYDFFRHFMSSETRHTLLETSVDDDSRNHSNFVLCSMVGHGEIEQVPAQDDIPDNVSNILQLIDCIRKMRYLPQVDTSVWDQIMTAIESLSHLPPGRGERLRTDVADMEKKMADIWKLINAAGKPDAPGTPGKPSSVSTKPTPEGDDPPDTN